jgi:hypothetical protein
MSVKIMRGIPGSGKSTWMNDFIQSSSGGCFVCSADLFFMDDHKFGSVYKFDASKLGAAHKWCFEQFLAEMNQNSFLLVDNTNIRIWELAPYYRLSEVLDGDVEIIQMVCDPNVAAGRNEHGVPRDKVLKMYNALEPLPDHYKVRYVFSGEK